MLREGISPRRYIDGNNNHIIVGMVLLLLVVFDDYDLLSLQHRNLIYIMLNYAEDINSVGHFIIIGLYLRIYLIILIWNII